jgi:tetratricopeptide (TPR) repeat protein
MRRVAVRELGLVLLFLLTAACAQAVRPPQAISGQIPTTSPSVRGYLRGVKDEGHLVDLAVHGLDVDVLIRGNIAETSMEFGLVAAAGVEPAEGRLHIDLPPGSVITGYALDVNGGLVDGSLIDQSKARSAYEQQVRKQADPGYTEVDQTGGFNTRIFPISNDRPRRVRVRFVTPFAEEYRLPLQLGASSELNVHVSYPGLPRPPAISLDGVHFKRTASVAAATAKGPRAGVLRVSVPPSDTNLVSRHSSGEVFWQLSGPLPNQELGTGGSLRIYWDRSRSRRDQDHAAELDRIGEAVAALKPARIEWVAFSSGGPERATITTADLDMRVSDVRYAGATSFAALQSERDASTCLVVSDARVTFGTTLPPRLPCRVFAIASAGANLALLQQMADSTGGKVISAPTRTSDWLSPSVSSVTDRGRSIPFVSLPAPSGWWRIIFPATNTDQVQVSIGSEQVVARRKGQEVKFDGEGALIASSNLATLEEATDRATFIDVSRRYSVASPTLSFVVLERPEDYVTYNVAPPVNYTRHDEWAQLAAEAAEDKAEAKQKRFAILLKDWNEEVDWWRKKFDVNARPKKPETKTGLNVPSPAVVASPLAPPPPPPPAPVAERDNEPAEASPVRTQDLVVTGTRIPVRPADVQIAVSAWRPDRDYLNAFDADPAAFDRVFPEWEKKAGDVPSFYLDTADWLYRKGRVGLAIETLLSALDLPSANELTLGMVAARLERYGAIDDAVALREKQASLDPDHPQPRRLLALALARRASMGRVGARDDLTRAIGILTDIALNPIDQRWEGVDVISLLEANRLLVRLQALGGHFDLDPRLKKNLDTDVRVVLDWSSDAADIDLWVDEPNGERAIYNHPRTLIGGHLSNDMTSGFGPEEYFLRRAAPGRYVVRANVFAPDRLDPNGMSRVTAHLYRDWGRSNEREESIDLDLQRGQNGEVRIGTLKVEHGSR